jgi:hypothetical protein
VRTTSWHIFRIESTILLATMSSALLGVFVDFLVSVSVVTFQHFWLSWQLPRSTSAAVSALVMLAIGYTRAFVGVNSRDISVFSHGERVGRPAAFEPARGHSDVMTEEIEFNSISGPSRAMLAVGTVIVSVAILTSSISQSWSLELPRYGGALLIVLVTWAFLLIRSTNWLPSFSPVWISTPIQFCRISVRSREHYELGRVHIRRLGRSPFRRLGIVIVSIFVDQDRHWTGMVDARTLDDVLKSLRFKEV